MKSYGYVKYANINIKIRQPGWVLHSLFGVLHRLSVNIDLGKEFPGKGRLLYWRVCVMF